MIGRLAPCVFYRQNVITSLGIGTSTVFSFIASRSCNCSMLSSLALTKDQRTTIEQRAIEFEDGTITFFTLLLSITWQ